MKVLLYGVYQEEQLLSVAENFSEALERLNNEVCLSGLFNFEIKPLVTIKEL